MRSPMRPTRMACEACGVQVEAEFGHQRLAALSLEHQRFIEMFILPSGSQKEIVRADGCVLSNSSCPARPQSDSGRWGGDRPVQFEKSAFLNFESSPCRFATGRSTTPEIVLPHSRV